MRVLLVEDDGQLAELLGRVFREEGHSCVVCGTIAAADAAIAIGDVAVATATTKAAPIPFDIVVLDWMLPDGDGLSLCGRLRAEHPTLPILMLTARGEVKDRIIGLRSGADDYLGKPFDVEELLARVASIHRRTSIRNTSSVTPSIRTTTTTTTVTVLQIDGLAIDLRKSMVTIDGGQRVDLTAREMALLWRLAESPGVCVSRQDLLTDVWNLSRDPGSGILDVHVSRLREKLGARALMIETVRGRGFLLRTKL